MEKTIDLVASRNMLRTNHAVGVWREAVSQNNAEIETDFWNQLIRTNVHLADALLKYLTGTGLYFEHYKRLPTLRITDVESLIVSTLRRQN